MGKLCELADDCPVRRRRAQARRLAEDPKRKGELAELAFVLTAASYGLVVSKPYGESAPYDFVVQGKGRPQRIQVKASFSRHRAGYLFNLGHHGRHYTAKDADFLAAYLGPLDAWYILPIELVQAISAIAVNPGARDKQSGARFEPYREAWQLLTGRSRRRRKKAEVADTPSGLSS